MNAKLPATLAGYRTYDRHTQPEYHYPPYASTVKRSPSQPLVPLQASLSEITGPIFASPSLSKTAFVRFSRVIQR